MSWNNTIPAEFLSDVLDKPRERFKGIPEFGIRPQYLTSVNVEMFWIDPYLSDKGEPVECASLSHTDHPSFTALRKSLALNKFIKINELCWNCDFVLTRFRLNVVEPIYEDGKFKEHLKLHTFTFEKGDRFNSAAALGAQFACRSKS